MKLHISQKSSVIIQNHILANEYFEKCYKKILNEDNVRIFIQKV